MCAALCPKRTHAHMSTVVIVSSLTVGTGNLTTAQRIAGFLSSSTSAGRAARRVVLLRDCTEFNSAEELDTFLDDVRATAVIGVHLYRAGRLFSPRGTLCRARALILGGTDVNENVHDAEKVSHPTHHNTDNNNTHNLH